MLDPACEFAFGIVRCRLFVVGRNKFAFVILVVLKRSDPEMTVCWLLALEAANAVPAIAGSAQTRLCSMDEWKVGRTVASDFDVSDFSAFV